MDVYPATNMGASQVLEEKQPLNTRVSLLAVSKTCKAPCRRVFKKGNQKRKPRGSAGLGCAQFRETATPMELRPFCYFIRAAQRLQDLRPGFCQPFSHRLHRLTNMDVMRFPGSSFVGGSSFLSRRPPPPPVFLLWC